MQSSIAKVHSVMANINRVTWGCKMECQGLPFMVAAAFRRATYKRLFAFCMRMAAETGTAFRWVTQKTVALLFCSRKKHCIQMGCLRGLGFLHENCSRNRHCVQMGYLRDLCFLHETGSRNRCCIQMGCLRDLCFLHENGSRNRHCIQMGCLRDLCFLHENGSRSSRML